MLSHGTGQGGVSSKCPDRQALSWRIKFSAGKFPVRQSPCTWRHSSGYNRHQQVQVSLPRLGIPGLHRDPRGLHKVPGKAPDTQSLQSPCSRGAAGAGTSVSPHRRGPARAAHRCTTAPRATRPGLEGRREAAGATDPAGGRGRGRPCANPGGEGARGGAPRRKDAPARRGRGGGGVPGRTLTHRLALLPARAPRRSPLRLSPRASPHEAQRPAKTRGAAEKPAHAEGV